MGGYGLPFLMKVRFQADNDFNQRNIKAVLGFIKY
jgi:hypothetical protein